MNAILNHRWGESRAADRVWSQVAGMAPSLIASRWLLSFRAFMDENETEGGSFVLAGVVAPVATLAEFSREWENVLMGKHGTISDEPCPKQHFKMSEMALHDERMKRVPVFWDIALRHSVLLLSISFKKDDLSKALYRIRVPGHDIGWGTFSQPYVYGFDVFMRVFLLFMQSHGAKILPEGSTLDFIFDDRSEKRAIWQGWDYFMERQSPEVRRRFGTAPRFEPDHEFLPIQAADLLAWYVRKSAETGAPVRPPVVPGSGEGLIWLDMAISEEWIREDAARAVRSRIGPGQDVVDLKTGLSIGHGSLAGC